MDPMSATPIMDSGSFWALVCSVTERKDAGDKKE